MRIKGILIILCLIIFLGSVATPGFAEDTFSVQLPCTDKKLYWNPFPIKKSSFHEGWYTYSCTNETIEIPNGRPIYALLVSGYEQNRNLDMFHWYNFAKCLQEKGAYVHFAWWNNLLKPYMKRPLHNTNSVPSVGTFSRDAHDALLFRIGDPSSLPVEGYLYPNKAIPAEDYQFQQDATALLIAIRQHNPDAAIILVGHSMGGDAVIRLADSMPTNFVINLLAPMDPVGNRTCLPNTEGGEVDTWSSTCMGLSNFKRFYAVREDWAYSPRHRELGTNIKYLYHRWQTEFLPPFDYGILDLFYSSYSLHHPEQRETSIISGSNNVQAVVATSLLSGYDAYPRSSTPNWGGGLDGHGEMVGFRDVYGGKSYPMALTAQGDWPQWQPGDPNGGPFGQDRVDHLKKWEADPNYLRDNGFAPMAPDLCMVSDDMCTILNTKLELPEPPVNSAPVAGAGPDQIVECSGPNGTEVVLDGSDSSDPDGDNITFTWVGMFGTMTGETIYPYFPLGMHTITLTVDDGKGNTDTDITVVTVMDSTAPTLSVSLSPNVLWPPNHEKVSITASIQVSDTCDDSPMVELESIVCNEPDNGLSDGNTNDDIKEASYGTDDRAFSLRAERAGSGDGRIYSIYYEAADSSGNSVTVSENVTVPHNK